MKKRKTKTIGITIGILLILIGSVFVFLSSKKMPKEEAVETAESILKGNDEKIETAKKNEVPSIVISSAEAKQGDTVKISVSIVNNPGVLGMSLTLSYDESVMELVSAENGNAVKDVLDMNHSKTMESGCVFLWDGEKIDSNQIQDGEILNLEFKVLKSAPVGKTQVLLVSDEGGIVNNNLESLELNIENGFINVVQ
ncbi:cohesin domain-containing protein [Blautia stercoris]|nr:cohesin domain-containing protein [Blautia stercoris]